MLNILRDISLDLKRKKSTQKQEMGTQGIQAQKKTYQNHRFKKYNPDNIINLSTYILNTAEKNLFI